MIRTRFPPEPNGFLHIGHCKSIFINFSEKHDCHLRLDDTNPKSERQEFVNNIIYDLEWLLKKKIDHNTITYTSDYFDKLYNYAILLIKNNKAYVDFTPKEEMQNERHNGIENNYRNKSIEYHLEEFENMKNGKYQNGNVVLRLKIDMKNNNHVLRDPVAYRIEYTPHYRTQNKWVIYPSYDYSHSIIDALEHITHSYCTDEFYIRRDLYYWVVNTLNECLPKEDQLIPADEIEYGKISVENNILSKRNINKLIEDKIINSYNDPRLLTISGLRNRGFTPSMIKKIVSTSGFDRKETIINCDFIDHIIREELNEKCHRYFAVIDPLKVIINDFKEEYKDCIHINHPLHHEYKTHNTKLNKELYIEKEDFNEIHDKKYYRFTPENKVRLKYDDFYTYDHYDKKNEILYIKETNVENPKKIKGCIHWVSKEDSIEALFYLYDPLLNNGIINENSKIIKNGYVEKSIIQSIENGESIWQFERLGYFKFNGFENNKYTFIRVTGLYDSNKI